MKEDIISITLTELSLVLLFVIITISYSGFLSGNGINSSSMMQDLKKSLKQSEMELNRVRKELMILQRENEKRKTKKLAVKGFLDTVTILPGGKYQSADSSFSVAEMRQHYKSDITFAKNHGCVHSIKVIHGATISLNEYLKSLKKTGTMVLY